MLENNSSFAVISKLQSKYFRFLCAILAAFGALLIGEHVYLKEYLTTDENSYLFQAWLFLQGQISQPSPPGVESFFHRMVINDEQAGWLSRYPPAHAVWMMPGVAIDYPRIMVAVAAFLSVWFLTKAGDRLNIPIWMTVGLLFASPYFWLMQGSVLSHTSGLAATAIMMWAYITWLEDRKNNFLMIAGLAWAFLFLNRTFTAFLIAIPFGIHVLYELIKSRKLHDLIGTIVFASSAFIGVILFFIYNYLVTGDPLLPTYLYYNKTDGLGFGIRNQPDYLFTPQKGWEFIRFNIEALNVRLWGFWGSLIAWIALALAGWRSQGVSLMMLFATLLVWLGYGAFWFKGIKEVAPVYYYETLVFMILLAGLGVNKIFSMDWRIPKVIKVFVSIAIIALVAQASARTFHKYGSEIIHRHIEKAHYQKMIKAVPPNSIVLLAGFPRDILDETSWNSKGIYSDPLIMRASHGSLHLIHHYYPSRKVYIVDGKPARPPKLIKDIDENIPYLSAHRMPAKVGTRTESGRRIAQSPEDEKGALGYGVKYYFIPGTYKVTYYIKAEGEPGDIPGIIDLVDTRTGSRLGYKELTPGEENVVFEIDLDELKLVEPRVEFNGQGRLEFDRIEIQLIENNLDTQHNAS